MQHRPIDPEPIRYVMVPVKALFGYRFQSVVEEPSSCVQLGRLIIDPGVSAIVKAMFKAARKRRLEG